MPNAGAISPRVLIVDDDPTQADLLGTMLELEGFDPHVVYSPKEAISSFRGASWPVVVSDFNMPELNGLQLFEQLKVLNPDLLFVMVTAFGTLETAVECMRAGVHDFVTKPVDVPELTAKLLRAQKVAALQVENRDLRGEVDALREKIKIVGESAIMQELLQKVAQVAASPATVLLQGESGTGKELVARAIHLQSPRHAKPYVKINCAAIPENLIEAELFGHVKGAFTGALDDRTGRFAAANGGTILLDEVGELPLAMQPKLLRVLQEKEIEPVGSTETIPVDVRVVAATHRDLKEMVAEGSFREDLWYRLNVIPLRLPPLRERADDVLLLAKHFLQKFAEENSRPMVGFTKQAEERLRTWSWSGNVRELENCIERAVVLSTSDVIDTPDLFLEDSGAANSDELAGILDLLFNSSMTLDLLERDLIAGALKRCDGNLSRTARTLGVTRRALQYRVEKMRSETNDDPKEAS